MPCISQFENSLSPLIAGRQLSFLDFQVVSLIGAGSSGSVFHVIDQATSRDFAMKIIPIASENAELALREYFTLREVAGAPFTITLRGFFSDDINCYLLTDYFPSGDIYAQVDRTGKMSSSQVRYFIAELIIALEHVHSKRVIHRDVNPTNILVDEEGHITLADFGVSRSFGDKPTGSCVQSGLKPFVTSTECGTPAYNSPEVARNQSYSFEADMWAVGVVMYQMLTHRLPFGLAECEAAGWRMGDAIHSVPFTVEDSDGIDKITVDFMDRVLKKDVKDRMSLEEMKDHIYFAGIDFNTCSKRKSGRPFPPRIRSSHTVPPIPTPSPINHSSDPRTNRTYFVDNVLKPTRLYLFMRFVARLGRFVGRSAEPTPRSFTPATALPSTVSEASINDKDLYRCSKNPFAFESLDWGEDSPPVATPKDRTTLYPGPRLPSVMREEILSRRESVGVRRRVSVIVEDDRLDEVPPATFRRLGLARSGSAVWNLASMALSPVMEGEEDREIEGGEEGKRNSSSHAASLVRSEAAHWDLSSLA